MTILNVSENVVVLSIKTKTHTRTYIHRYIGIQIRVQTFWDALTLHGTLIVPMLHPGGEPR